jgi:hypothetical protein
VQKTNKMTFLGACGDFQENQLPGLRVLQFRGLKTISWLVPELKLRGQKQGNAKSKQGTLGGDYNGNGKSATTYRHEISKWN